jgi:hypothetical protein
MGLLMNPAAGVVRLIFLLSKICDRTNQKAIKLSITIEL